ncbi:MAG: DUF6363 domain-containing protein, partial [Christensenella sp.]
NRSVYYNKSIEIAEQQERDGNAVIIRPTRPIIAGRMEKDPHKLTAQYNVGYNDAMAQKERLLSFLRDSENVRLKQSL